MKVIRYKNLPSSLPINFTVCTWLLMDRFPVPQWAWGVWATLLFILWVVSIIGLLTQKTVDIFEEEK